MEHNSSRILTKRDEKQSVDHTGTKDASNSSPKCQSEFNRVRNMCLVEKCLFEDWTFPADNSSLYFSKRPPKNIKWLRPSEITHDPHLFIDGRSRFDVVQGRLGNCWMVSAVGCLTSNKELFRKVVPRGQSFTKKYAGIFHFRFWQYGEWVDVEIDDRLPTRHGKLVFMHSESRKEFWSALLEKAYAKLHGSYEALEAGFTSEAFVDITGGLTQRIDLRRAPSRLNEKMWQVFKNGVLFGCGIDADVTGKEGELDNGLVTGHVYSITGMSIVKFRKKEVYLLRIRNPWGKVEWNGAWKDGCPNWRHVSDCEKQEMNIRFREDGEFYMCFEDFLKHFDDIDICFMNPGQMYEFYEGKSSTFDWTTITFNGDWIPQKNSKYIYTSNCPQYRIRLTNPDPEDDDDLTVIITVIQKDRRKIRHLGFYEEEIGVSVYEISEPEAKKYNIVDELLENNEAIQSREVTYRFRLEPGEYTIIPFTSQKNLHFEFMLNIHTNGIIEQRIAKHRLILSKMTDPLMPQANELAEIVPLMVEHGDLLFGNKSAAYRTIKKELEGKQMVLGEEQIERVVRTTLDEFSTKQDLPEPIAKCGADPNLLNQLLTVITNGDPGYVPYVETELKIIVNLLADSEQQNKEPDYSEMIKQLKNNNYERTLQQLKNWRKNLSKDIEAITRTGVTFIYDENHLIVPQKVQKLMGLGDPVLANNVRLINRALWRKYGTGGTTRQAIYEEIVAEKLAAMQISTVKKEEPVEINTEPSSD